MLFRSDASPWEKTSISGRIFFSDANVKLNSSPDTKGTPPTSNATIIDANPNVNFVPDANDPDSFQHSRFFNGQFVVNQVINRKLVLGGYYQGRGDLPAAEPFFRRSLDIRERVLGSEHPLTLSTLDNLAHATLELGRLDEAERLSRRVLAARERSCGLEHPDTAIALTAVGEVLTKKGEFEAAEPLLRRALAVQQKHLPEGSPDTGVSMWHLAEMLRGLQRVDEAEPLARRALEVWEASFGPEHEWTAWGLISIAEIRLRQGAPVEAATLADRAVQILQKVFGERHAVLGSTLNLQGRALLASGEYRFAEAALARALTIQTELSSAVDPVAKATAALLHQARAHALRR